jgi:hypothetical protein
MCDIYHAVLGTAGAFAQPTIFYRAFIELRFTFAELMSF